jgi:hypothetical protein
MAEEEQEQEEDENKRMRPRERARGQKRSPKLVCQIVNCKLGLRMLLQKGFRKIALPPPSRYGRNDKWCCHINSLVIRSFSFNSK